MSLSVPRSSSSRLLGSVVKPCCVSHHWVAPTERRPYCLDLTASKKQIRPVPRAPVDARGAFLHDPDPSVVRAGLIDRLAAHLDAWKLDARTAYLSSNSGAASPFAQVFRVLWDMPFNLKGLKRALSQQGLRAEEIKKRHFPIEPEEMRRLLRVKPRKGDASTGTTRPVTLVLTRIAQRPHAFVCERITI